MPYCKVDTVSDTPLQVTRCPSHNRPVKIDGDYLTMALTDDEAVKLVRAMLAALPDDLHADAIPTALARAVRA